MQKLPRVRGDKHIAALKKAGWKLNHVEGSNHICIWLLKKLIAMAGLTNEEYLDTFYNK
jgi:hypothetical protein